MRSYRVAVEIRRADLVAQSACEAGLAIFDAIACLQGDSAVVRIDDWTQLHDAWLATTGRSSWLADAGFVPRANLAGAYLARADLALANLEGANIARAYLAAADLKGCLLYTSPSPRDA